MRHKKGRRIHTLFVKKKPEYQDQSGMFKSGEQFNTLHTSEILQNTVPKFHKALGENS
jgi:hypothetical protein